MDNAYPLSVTQDTDTDEYGSDITIPSIDFARNPPNSDVALISADNSFMQTGPLASTSDYGSDIGSDDERELLGVFTKIEGSRDFQSGIEVKESEELDDNESLRGLRLPKILSSQDSSRTSVYFSAVESLSQTSRRTSAGVGLPEPDQAATLLSIARTADGEIDDRPGHKTNIVQSDNSTKTPYDVQQTTPEIASQQPLKTPINRFRASRPLSVSDLVSPTWCEVQYSKNLDKHGKIPRSAAMKRGGEVHKQLELEVHDFVPVEVRTQEDAWGLRIWNVIQGLRTLRMTGMTRELDVWGVVGGELISGVIDELSFTCPDPELEMSLQPTEQESSSQKVDPDQMTIDEFFASRKVKQEKIEAAGQQLYLLDTKTRAYPNLPSESSMRATKIQLMLYRHLLSLHATNNVPSDTIFARYKLQPTKPFSPEFINDIAQLDFNFASHPTSISSEAATVSELRTHSNLATLWGLMATEFVITFSDLALSPILTAVYRTQSNGSLIGQRTFVHDDVVLMRHVEDELRWWRGQRAARGVEIEDAFKCKMCEFAEGCEWRLAKEVEAVERARGRAGKSLRSPGRKMSGLAKVMTSS